jgi:hypothetical protein
MYEQIEYDVDEPIATNRFNLCVVKTRPTR